MLPTIEEAMHELEVAGKLNPGPWVKHSINVGIAARNIAEKIPEMNPQKAYIVGIMHDIGRRVGIVDIPTHVYDVLPDIGKTTLLTPKPWEPPVKSTK
ncbi:MAG: HDOD domain-containing protein [Spirochaetaceae bacterium]|nr:HDOD domain-containing protein [Spirochaetaceae bacterium]